MLLTAPPPLLTFLQVKLSNELTTHTDHEKPKKREEPNLSGDEITIKGRGWMGKVRLAVPPPRPPVLESECGGGGGGG